MEYISIINILSRLANDPDALSQNKILKLEDMQVSSELKNLLKDFDWEKFYLYRNSILEKRKNRIAEYFPVTLRFIGDKWPEVFTQFQRFNYNISLLTDADFLVFIDYFHKHFGSYIPFIRDLARRDWIISSISTNEYHYMFSRFSFDVENIPTDGSIEELVARDCVFLYLKNFIEDEVNIFELNEHMYEFLRYFSISNSIEDSLNSLIIHHKNIDKQEYKSLIESVEELSSMGVLTGDAYDEYDRREIK